VDEDCKAGRFRVVWDASAQPSGVYYYRFQTVRSNQKICVAEIKSKQAYMFKNMIQSSLMKT
jgi:hypothetical protein